MARIVSVLPGKGYDDLPWQEWFNGEVWELVKGEDFDKAPANMATYILHTGKKMGFKVVTRVRGDSVFFQARLNMSDAKAAKFFSDGNYPWDEWEKKAGHLTQGVDFPSDVEMESFRSTFATHFRRMGYDVSTTVTGKRFWFSMEKR